MRKNTLPFVGVYALALSTLAIAEWPVEAEWKQMQAHTLSLENQTAVVYYLENATLGYDVVATIASNHETAGPAVQHRISLTEGQSFVLGLDDASKGEPKTLTIKALPGSLQVTPL